LILTVLYCAELQVSVIAMTGRCGNFDQPSVYNERDSETWLTDDEFTEVMAEPKAEGTTFGKGKHSLPMTVEHNA
jgi:hypothetical protein